MRIFALLLATLSLATACDLIDFGGGDDGETGNQPPGLDWTLTTPADLELTYDRSTGMPLQFSVLDAVWDPDADQIFFLWVSEVPSGATLGHPGERLMTLAICDSVTLQTATEAIVTVAIADEPISYDPNGALFPLSPEEAEYVTRSWTVYLMGECP
jgi:hypothetical protein